MVFPFPGMYTRGTLGFLLGVDFSLLGRVPPLPWILAISLRNKAKNKSFKLDNKHLLINEPSFIKSTHKLATMATELNYTVKVVFYDYVLKKSPVVPQISLYAFQSISLRAVLHYSLLGDCIALFLSCLNT